MPGGPDASRPELNQHLEQLAVHHQDDFRAASLARRLVRLSEGGRVLDAGCGTGRLTIELLRAGRSVLAVDHEEAMVALTNRVVAGAGFTEEAGFAGPVARSVSLEELDQLSSSSFDEIYCCDVVEHVPDDRLALDQIRSLLKPGGRLILTVPAWPFLYGERDERMGHFRRYTRRAVREALHDSRFQLESLRWWNLSGFLLNSVLIRGLGLKFSERFRYDRERSGRRLGNRFLNLWFHGFENHVPVPAGLTLIAVARRTD